MINCCGCASSKKSRTVKAGYDKDDPQTVTVEDKDYYTRFKGQNKSINVYNWGEYVADGSEEGMLDTNKEFEELTDSIRGWNSLKAVKSNHMITLPKESFCTLPNDAWDLPMEYLYQSIFLMG